MDAQTSVTTGTGVRIFTRERTVGMDYGKMSFYLTPKV